MRINKPNRPYKPSLFLATCFLLFSTACIADNNTGPSPAKYMKDRKEKTQKAMKEKIKKEIQDRISGMPGSVLALQNDQKIILPTQEHAAKQAQQAAATAAQPLIDRTFHQSGKTITIPDDHPTIQDGIDHANPGDTVVVKAGTYYEQLVMEEGVKLRSDNSNDGDALIATAGSHLLLPRRTLRTIIDGSKAQASARGMVDFNAGISRHTIIDGFTIRHLPMQDHHQPGHAHALKVRGASPLIMNNLIHDNGSTGIGSHVIFNDAFKPMPQRDLRYANIRHQASAVIYNNVIYNNIGLGIGCNHYSSPFVLGNEVFQNSDPAGSGMVVPGMGGKHGATPTIIGNIVHHNPGGGIATKQGSPQGKIGFDRPTRPIIQHNVVYKNGRDRAQISSQGTGSEKKPSIISHNYISDSGAVGIGISGETTAIIENNFIMNTVNPGISAIHSTLLKLNNNKITNRQKAPGILIGNRSQVKEMVGNAVAPEKDAPRFLIDPSSHITMPTQH